jgi:hypothetical protein
MSTAERTDARRRWILAATASVLIHASLLLWWRGIDLAGGDGSGGASGGGRAGAPGFGPGSVIEVQIDVDAPVAAGTMVPAQDVTLESMPVPADMTAETATPADEPAVEPAAPAPSGGGGSDGGSGIGEGTGEGSETGRGEGLGAGEAQGTGGVGARTVSGNGPPGGGTVPPRPVEITWPDTRKLAHCVGLRIDVRIRVDALGRVERVEPASQGLPPDCVQAALDTAKRIRFTPGTVSGKPAALWTLVTIDFEKKK